jgi:hypothetical protein
MSAREQIEALRSEIERHLSTAHDGTAIHTILSALKVMIGPPETVEHDPSEEPHG